MPKLRSPIKVDLKRASTSPHRDDIRYQKSSPEGFAPRCSRGLCLASICGRGGTCGSGQRLINIDKVNKLHHIFTCVSVGGNFFDVCIHMQMFRDIAFFLLPALLQYYARKQAYQLSFVRNGFRLTQIKQLILLFLKVMYYRTKNLGLFAVFLWKKYVTQLFLQKKKILFASDVYTRIFLRHSSSYFLLM